MARSVGTITADLIARTKRFEAGMTKARGGLRGLRQSTDRARRAKEAFNRVAKKMLGIIAAVAGARAMMRMAQNAMRLGAELSNLSRQLNINIEAMQVYNGLMRNAGGTQEQMTSALQRMQQAIVQGGDGLTTYTRAFERLNLNVDDLAKLRPEEQFEKIAQAVANAENQQQALTAVSEIFGRSAAPQLMTVLNRLGTEGYGELAKEIRRTFGIMDQETADRLEEAGNRIEQFKTRMTIRLGEIIVGDQNFAALKEFGFRMLAVAATFRIYLREQLRSAIVWAGRGFATMFDEVVERFVEALNEGINKLLERIDPRGRIADVSNRVMDATIGRLPPRLQAAARMAGEMSAGSFIPGLGLGLRGSKQGFGEEGSASTFLARTINTLSDKIEEIDLSSLPLSGDGLPGYFNRLADVQRAILEEAATERANERNSLRRVLIGADAPDEDAAGSVDVPRFGSMMPSMGSGPASPMLTGDALRRAAGQAGGRDIRFERLAGGGFQRFFQGRASGVFEEGELQRALSMGDMGALDSISGEDAANNQQSTIAEAIVEIRDLLFRLDGALQGG